MRARRESELSQTEIAARMGTSQSAVARLESGDLDARLSTLERYAAALGRTVDWQVRPVRGVPMSPIGAPAPTGRRCRPNRPSRRSRGTRRGCPSPGRRRPVRCRRARRDRGVRTGSPSGCSTSGWSPSPASWTTRRSTGRWPRSALLDADGDEPVRLRLSGVSADLGAALTLVDALDLMGVPVHATCLGTLTGPAVALLAVADRRVAGPHATLHLCEPRGAARHARPRAGDAWAAEHARQLRRLQERLAEACGRPVEEIAADMRRAGCSAPRRRGTTAWSTRRAGPTIRRRT